ncbi:MAG TPA: TIGR02757 family protein [Bacteroidia bacterium]|nr:TIGR02757 family protein [Bacteroidia bacterium]
MSLRSRFGETFVFLYLRLLMLSHHELKDYLDAQYKRYNSSFFIETDPIQIPHSFSNKEDISISGFFAATLAWGQRPTIIKNSKRLMELMDEAPHDFIINHTKKDRDRFTGFVHRTFNADDCKYYLFALQQLYKKYEGLEGSFKHVHNNKNDLSETLHQWRKLFLSFKSETRQGKHLGDPLKNSTAKRLLMYLRWMVRKDQSGIDFGLWKAIKPSELYIPLDIHSARSARILGLLTRTQNDWKAVNELTENLRIIDAKDPVKYDFALYGSSVNKAI